MGSFRKFETISTDAPVRSFLSSAPFLPNCVASALATRGWSLESGPFELPQGPCVVLRDPGRQRLAAYERVRDADRWFEGRFDAPRASGG